MGAAGKPPQVLTLSKRRFLSLAGGAAGAAGLSRLATAVEPQPFDIIIVGGGAAGLSAAIFAARRRVLILESSDRLGGSLVAGDGVLAAAGTKFQKSRDIADDTPRLHFDDVMRASGHSADAGMVRLAVFNAADTVDWLMDGGLDVPAGFPVSRPPLSDPYSRARYVVGADGGGSILRILDARLRPHIDSGRVTVVTGAKAARLTQDAAGRVTGVEATDRRGQTVRYRGLSVVLATGGDASGPHALDGRATYADRASRNQEAGIALGVAAGGYARGGDKHFPMFGAVMANERASTAIVPVVRHWPPDRAPWEIFVNARGERFYREDMANAAAQRRALMTQPGERCWCVFDGEILNDAPPLLRGWPREAIAASFDKGQPGFYSADTLEALSRAAGIDDRGLVATVARYNKAQRYGDDPFGRECMPRQIAKAPFYALRLQGYAAANSAGLAVDENLRVVRENGAPIPGLYAAGEILGAGQLMGDAYCGGMIVTPALTFGRLLGQASVLRL